MENKTEQSIGDKIRELRKEKGLTQEDLAAGICSAVSVSRIENGTQTPSGKTLEKLLERLGTGVSQVCSIYSESRTQQEFQEKTEHIAFLLSTGNIPAAKKEMDKINHAKLSNASGIQSYLFLQAAISFYEGDTEKSIPAMLKKALKLTKPSFDDMDFRHVLFSPTEANILIVMAAAHYRSGNILEAIRLDKELLTALQLHKSNLKQYGILKINTAFNLAQYMEKEGRHKEAMIYCQQAETFSYEGAETLLLPEILFIKAKLFHRLGNTEECTRILKAIVPYMELTQKKPQAEIIRTYANQEFGISL